MPRAEICARLAVEFRGRAVTEKIESEARLENLGARFAEIQGVARLLEELLDALRSGLRRGEDDREGPGNGAGCRKHGIAAERRGRHARGVVDGYPVLDRESARGGVDG